MTAPIHDAYKRNLLRDDYRDIAKRLPVSLLDVWRSEVRGRACVKLLFDEATAAKWPKDKDELFQFCCAELSVGS